MKCIRCESPMVFMDAEKDIIFCESCNYYEKVDYKVNHFCNDINELIKAIRPILEIECHKCTKTSKFMGKENTFAEFLHSLGWTAKKYAVLCPECKQKIQD